LADIRKIVGYAADKFSEEEGLVGVFLFGSATYGGLDEESDVDVCFIYDGPEIRRNREVKELNGIRLDICRYPGDRFARVFEGEGSRGKEATWFDVSLWLGMMRGCEIIRDPHGLLRRWKEAAGKWSWRDGEIRPLQRLFLKNLSAAQLSIQQGSILETLIYLREATSAVIYVRLMKEDLVPFWDPRFLYRSLASAHQFKGLVSAFMKINELDVVTASRLRLLMNRLRSFVEDEGGENVGVVTQFHNSRDGYWRRQYASSLLSARFTAFLLAPIILAKRHIVLEPIEERILDGGQHVEMIDKLKSAKSFHDLYLSLLLLKRWDISALKGAFGDLCDLNRAVKL